MYSNERIQLYPSSQQVKDQESYHRHQEQRQQVFHVVHPRCSHQISGERNAERLHRYQQFQDDLGSTGIEFPVTIDKIGKFERQNNISVYVSRRRAHSLVNHKGTPWYPGKIYCSILNYQTLLCN